MLKNRTLKNKSEGSYDIEGWASAVVRITTEGSYVTQLFGNNCPIVVAEHNEFAAHFAHFSALAQAE